MFLGNSPMLKALAHDLEAPDWLALFLGVAILIARRSEEQQQELLSVAYEGEYWLPTCASCGVKMIDRVSGKGLHAKAAE